mmetsp:Transcript_6551/g.11084  ORF Transcript_6551/g.11084 Transcript_6551/m.11084 type:complete len:124 (+) Transcript_6551:480-851(+)
MDTPSDAFQQKLKLKEMLKLEPSKMEKAYLKTQKDMIERLRNEERIAEKIKERAKIKDLYCMGIKTKLAKGPNPLSIKRPQIRPFPGQITKRKRRLRKGKRSRELSQLKKQGGEAGPEQNNQA